MDHRSRKAGKLSDVKILAELEKLVAHWDELRDDLEGHAGSPGEWIIERIAELETEQERRLKNKKSRKPKKGN